MHEKIAIIRNINQLNKMFNSASEVSFSIGQFLSSGLGLEKSLRIALKTTQNPRFINGLSRGISMLEKGADCHSVFASFEMSFLPEHVRVILASPLPDKIKGNLIVDWKPFKKTLGFEQEKQFAYLAQTTAVGSMTLMGLVLFVIPQFREILSSLGVRFSALNKVFFWFADFGLATSVLVITLILAAGFTIYFLFMSFSRVKNTIDYYNFFKILDVIEPEDRRLVLNYMANRIIFPKKHVQIRKFAMALQDGNDVQEALEMAGIEKDVSWFINIGFNSEKNKGLLDQSAELFRTKAFGGIARVHNLTEIGVIFIQASIFGFVAYCIFDLMNKVMLSSI